MLDTFYRAANSRASQALSLLLLRIAMAGLLLWWGLARGLQTGVGETVSDTFYGGIFSAPMLMFLFGWLEVAVAVLLAVGLLRAVLLPLQLVINVFVAATVWPYIVDPFWLFSAGEKPMQFGHLFYPSIIIAVASWVLIAFLPQDRLALDRLARRRSTQPAE